MQALTSINITEHPNSPITPGETPTSAWAWNGSMDSLPAFIWYLVRFLQSAGRDTTIFSHGTIFNQKNHKTIYASIEHFHKCSFCELYGVVHDINTPFIVPLRAIQ